MALASDLGGSLYFKGQYSSVSNQGGSAVDTPIIATMGSTTSSSASQDLALFDTSLLKTVDYDSVYGISMGGGGAVIYYRLRGRDSACGPVTYVYWTSTDANSSFPGPNPCGGPIVDVVVLEAFTQ